MHKRMFIIVILILFYIAFTQCASVPVPCNCSVPAPCNCAAPVPCDCSGQAAASQTQAAGTAPASAHIDLHEPGGIAHALTHVGFQAYNTPAEPADFTLPRLDGRNVTLSDLRGKVVVLNFWASWCQYSRTEKPSMEALFRRFSNQELELLAVNSREEAAVAWQYINDNNFSFPVLLDSNGAVTTSYGVRGLPTSFIIDRQGKIIATRVGFADWNDPTIVAAIEALLGIK